MRVDSVLNTMNFIEYSNIIPYIRYCAEDKYQDPWYLRKRKIGDYEFVFITKGKGEFEIDGRIYEVKPSDLILFKPNIFNQGKSISLPFEFLCIHFDLFVSKEKRNILLEQNKINESIPIKPIKYKKAILELPEYIKISDSSYIHVLLKRIIIEVNEKSTGYNLIVKSLFIDLFIALIRQFAEIEPPEIQCSSVNHIITYIKTNYMNRIHLSDLSKYVHLEPTYISSLFKKHTGHSITEYLKTYRLSIAKSLLLDTDYKIDEIASSVGFYDFHHFAKVFKLKEGITPTQYRQIKIS